MAKTFRNREEAVAWRDAADMRAPKAGDVAPGFELRDVSGNESVKLSDLRGQPVALVFGSFT